MEQLGLSGDWGRDRRRWLGSSVFVFFEKQRERERGRNLLFQDVFPLRKVYFSFVLLFAYLTSSRRGPVDRCLDRELRTAIFVVRTAAVVQIVATKH